METGLETINWQTPWLAPYVEPGQKLAQQVAAGQSSAEALNSALALYPALIGAQQEDRARSNRLLTTGLLLGMSGVAAVVLRERGVLHDMVYFQGLRQLLDSLLDFGTSYRITALFADMHTGGVTFEL